jgi:hypothetical protein
MKYPWTAIPESAIPRAANPVFQHMLETYVSESNKVASTWKQFTDADLAYKPHPRSSTVGDVLRHQLLSERRFFGEFLGTPEPAPDQVLPVVLTVESATDRFIELELAHTNRRCHVERSRPHEFGLRGRPPVARIAKIRVPNSSPFLSFPLRVML